MSPSKPLSGYLRLGAMLAQENGHEFASAWNFGPPVQSVCCVRDLVEELIEVWGSGSWEDLSDPNAVHEARFLALNWDKAYHQLGWQPVWDFQQCIKMTAAWFKVWQNEKSPERIRELCHEQMRDYIDAAAQRHIPWAVGC